MTDPDEKTAVEPESGAVEIDEPSAPVEVADAGEAEADVVAAEDAPVEAAPPAKGGIAWAKVLAFGVLPVLAVLLAAGVGWLAFTNITASRVDEASAQAIQTAKDSTIALLSYNPDTVEQQLTDARGLLTGEFKDSYTSLTNDVVIPGAKEQRISAVATVPAAASVSTETDDAVVLVFVNQTVVVGDTQPTATLSSVRVTLENVDGKWLISKFDPV